MQSEQSLAETGGAHEVPVHVAAVGNEVTWTAVVLARGFRPRALCVHSRTHARHRPQDMGQGPFSSS